MFARLTICGLIACTALSAANANLRYLGEIGQLAVSQASNELDLGPARVSVGASYLFTGQDAEGSRWSFPLAAQGNRSSTQVFAGDLDKNGREDLLVIRTHADQLACGTLAGDITLLFMHASNKPQVWQSAARLARARELPILVSDRNGNGLAEIALVACAGDTTALHGVYEIQPEGAPTPVKKASSYAGDVRKLYRTTQLGEAEPDAAPGTTLEQLATRTWGGFGSTETFTVSGSQPGAGWPKWTVGAIGFRQVSATGRDLTDLLHLMAQATPVRSDGPQSLRIYPAEANPAAQVNAKLVSGPLRERTLAAIEGEVPRTARDASFFLVRGADCFVFHIGNGPAAGAIHALNCEAAANLRAKGLQAPSVHLREGQIWQSDAATREWRVFDADSLTEKSRLKLPGDGQLQNVAPVDGFLFAQWRDDGGNWLTLHWPDGTPATGRLPIPATDQLLYVDEEKGLVFLRWSGDRPAAWVEAPARVEWRRAQ